MSDFVNMVDPVTGNTHAVPADRIADAQRAGWTTESADQASNRLVDEARTENLSGPAGTIAAGALGIMRGATLGGSDALISAAGGADDLRRIQAQHGIASLAGEAFGAFGGGGAGVTSLGARIARTAEGAGVLTRLGRGVVGGAVEGALFGAGSGVSELALSDDPLTMERAISTIGSHALLGGAIGGGAGALTKAAGIGLQSAQGKLDELAAIRPAAGDAERIALRDEVAAFRKEVKDSKVWLASKDTGVDGLQTVGKRTLKADKALDNLLDDPKALIDNPKNALRHLRVQESALQEVAAKTDEIRASLMKQGSTNQIAALEKVAPTLERNRALQAKIESLIAKPTASPGNSLAANMLGGQARDIARDVVSMIPLVGPALAPIAGAMASKAVTEGLGKLAAKQAARMSKAIDAFLTVGEKVGPVAPVLASKTLSAVRYGEGTKQPKQTENPRKADAPAPRIAANFKARTDEIKKLTQYDATGKAQMRPEARAKMAAHFDAIRPVDPIAADKAETLAARRYEFLADRIPRQPDVMGLAMGPSKWQPSDMDMRGWARLAAAVEDPAGVVERLAAGTITPEDRDAMKEVYPEMYRDIQTQIMAKLPTLRQTLPYQRRIALSIFSGIPVDPAMDPRILSVLQQSFVDEPGTEGGTQAPTPMPQFGSVKNQEATPSQERQGALT